MDYSKLVLGGEPTEEQLTALQQASEILDQVGLELIGGRPKDR